MELKNLGKVMCILKVILYSSAPKKALATTPEKQKYIYMKWFLIELTYEKILNSWNVLLAHLSSYHLAVKKNWKLFNLEN